MDKSSQLELYSLHRSPNTVRVNKSRILRWARYPPRIEEDRGTLKILSGESTGKRPQGKPTSRCEDNIKIDIK